MGDQLSKLLEECGERVPSAQRLRCPGQDAFAVKNVATWSQVANEAKNSSLPTAELHSARRVSVHPVTMEEMLELPRAISPDETELLEKAESHDPSSPLKKYMISMGGFPGSSHIAGENAEFLMSNFIY